MTGYGAPKLRMHMRRLQGLKSYRTREGLTDMLSDKREEHRYPGERQEEIRRDGRALQGRTGPWWTRERLRRRRGETGRAASGCCCSCCPRALLSPPALLSAVPLPRCLSPRLRCAFRPSLVLLRGFRLPRPPHALPLPGSRV